MFLFTSTQPPGDVNSALRYASKSTGVGFDYLLETAQRESSLDPQAQARASSARGLFQFIESTWLSVFKEAGPRHGYGELASGIRQTADGGYTTADPQSREAILALRDDPRAAAVMAGEFTRRNAESLSAALGRAPSQGELYMAHFLGARGASDLLRLAAEKPDAAAAPFFPRAAAANRPIFFDDSGAARSASQVRDVLVARHDADAPVPQGPPPGNASAALGFAPMKARPDRAFHGLFADGSMETQQTGRQGMGPLARAVSAFWSGLGAEASASAGDVRTGGTAGRAAAHTAAQPGDRRPLDLAEVNGIRAAGEPGDDRPGGASALATRLW